MAAERSGRVVLRNGPDKWDLLTALGNGEKQIETFLVVWPDEGKASNEIWGVVIRGVKAKDLDQNYWEIEADIVWTRPQRGDEESVQRAAPGSCLKGTWASGPTIWNGDCDVTIIYET